MWIRERNIRQCRDIRRSKRTLRKKERYHSKASPLLQAVQAISQPVHLNKVISSKCDRIIQMEH